MTKDAKKFPGMIWYSYFINYLISIKKISINHPSPDIDLHESYMGLSIKIKM